MKISIPTQKLSLGVYLASTLFSPNCKPYSQPLPSSIYLYLTPNSNPNLDIKPRGCFNQSSYALPKLRTVTLSAILDIEIIHAYMTKPQLSYLFKYKPQVVVNLKLDIIQRPN